MRTPTVAVIGGGQLARMMQEEASALGIHLRALVEAADGSTAQVTPDSPVGSGADEAAVRALLADADALTFEHEHQSDDLLERLVAEGVSVQPSPQALLLARDKLAMRRAMDAAGLPQPAWREVGDDDPAAMREQIAAFASEHDWPVVLKTPRGGYDGHGVLLVRSAVELCDGEAARWLDAVASARSGQTNAAAAGSGGSLGGSAVQSLLLEQAVPFTRELAALLARTPSGQVASWPVAQTIQADGMCSEVIAPAPGLPTEVLARAQRIGEQVAETFAVTGVLAVEMFAVEDAQGQVELFINELAMRPHNSGHWTQDGAITSQFAQHLRAVLDLPLGSPELTSPTTVMVNLLGGENSPADDAYARALAADPQAKIHLYGKEPRPRRKLGHVNLCLRAGESVEELRSRGQAVCAILRADA